MGIMDGENTDIKNELQSFNRTILVYESIKDTDFYTKEASKIIIYQLIIKDINKILSIKNDSHYYNKNKAQTS